MKPFTKSTPPWPCHFIKTMPLTKYQFTNINGNIYACLGAPLFQFSVTLQKSSFETWSDTQPHITTRHLNFVGVPLVWAQHTRHQILFPSNGQCLLCPCHTSGLFVG